jgi:esterase/lipase
VVVGGFSNGGALALELATRIEDVAAVFAISPPLRLKDLSSRLVPAVDVWNRFMKRFNMEDARMEFIDNKPENPHINYLRNPIAGVRQLERLMDAIGPRLPALMAPALIVQGQGDPIVNPKGSVRLFQRLGSRDKAYVLFSLERHGIVNGEGSERVFRVVWDFVERVSKRPGESQIRPAVQADAGAEKNDAAAGPQNRSEPI